MKKISVIFMTFVLAIGCTSLFGQQMGGRRRHMRMGVPPASGEMLNIANQLVKAINDQDGAAIQKLLAPDAVYLDEDGHAPPARFWVRKLTSGKKHITMSSSHSQMWSDAGWVSFNYELTEEYQGKPKTLVGTASLVCKKTGGDWKIVLVHGALKQTVAGITQ